MRDISQFITRFTRETGGLNPWGKLFVILAIVLGVFILGRLVHRIVWRSVSKNQREHGGRVVTLVGLLERIVRYVIYFFGFVLILQIIGISPQALIATAGVGSLAIGMGAQSLIKDLINGAFIIAEDQYSVGDVVVIGNYEGVVEELGMRVTRLRAFDGRLFIIPNGDVGIVTNNQRGNMRALVEISVPRDVATEKALQVIEEALTPFEKDPSCTGGPHLWGITYVGAESYVITAVAYAVEGEQYDLERRLRRAILDAFHEAKIPGPSRQTIIKGDVS